MLLGTGEAASLLSADGEEDTARHRAERADGCIDIHHARPAVAGLGLPFRAAKREDRNAGGRGRFRRIRRDLIGEGMRGVDKQCNAFLSQVINQSADAAEAADAGRQGQRFGVDRAAGKRYGGLEIAALRQRFGQATRFRRAAENENVGIAHG